MAIQPDEYEALVEKLFDDRLTDEELQRLNDVLRQSPEAREHYWHLVMLEGYLADLPGWIAGQQYATNLAFSETLEAFIEMESNAEAELQTYPPATAAIADARAEDQHITWQDIRTVGAFCLRSIARQKATWAVAATAAVICIAALIYATWFGGSSSQPPAVPFAELDQDPPRVTPPAVKPPTVAVVLNHFVGAGQASGKTMPPGTELAVGHAIELQAGNALQLEYKSGASVILQGPGEYELLSPDRVGMEHGRLNALVPPQAKGFTVSTTKTDFIDHGTEFVVALNKAGHGEVAVLDGLIEARQTSTQTVASPDQAESIMLHEGFGGRLAPDQSMPVSVQPMDTSQIDRYARNWDDAIYKPRISGEMTYIPTPPASLELGKANSTDPLLIPEQRGVVLKEDLYLNSNKSNRSIIKNSGAVVEPQQDYVIPAGTKLNSFLIHFDLPLEEIQGTVERNFKLQFKGRIVGIVEVQKYQVITDEILGLASVQYPGTGTLRGASDPPGHPNYDYIYVSDDLRTMSVKMRLSGMDQIRVLVENTDP